jgi:alpha-beta hydrolase superfamily lysophospholipase
MASSSLYHLLKKPFFGRYQTSAWRWPSDVAEGDWEPVQFQSPSGALLSGRVGRASDLRTKRGVVLAHPMGSAAKGFFLKNGVADMLRAAGFVVLVFDFNGFGESETGNFDYPGDVIAAGSYLKEEFELDDVGALGVSFGAAWIACAVSRPTHPFSAAVLESPFARLEEYWGRHPLAYAMLRAISVVQPALARSLRPVERIAELHGLHSALLVYGDEDAVTPVSVGERMLSAARTSQPPPPLELWVVERAEHMKAFQADRDTYRDRVVSVLGATS